MEFMTGDTLHCWVPSESYIPHKQMFYLGHDAEGEKVLVAHKTDGWAIILLDFLPEDGYRRLDRCNVIAESKNDKNKYNQITVLFWSLPDKFELTAKLTDGVWKLDPVEGTPSWLICRNDKKSEKGKLE